MVDWIIVRSLLSIAIIHVFPSRSIEFVIAFTRDYLDVVFFMNITLGMGFGVNRGKWFLKLNKPLFVINQAGENWFDILKTCLEIKGCLPSIYS